MSGSNSARLLIDWYKDSARTFLERNVSEEKLQAFDKDRSRLERVLQVSQSELSVCFLGNSGVGKSTLINAVIGGDQPVVPSGGVGPLTAQALVVRYGEQPRIKVEYYSSVQILRTVFGLEQMFKDQLGDPNTKLDDLEGADELEEAELVAPEEAIEDSSSSEQARIEKRESMRRRAQLLVTGQQDDERDLKYLLDSLREAAGGKRCWGTRPEERDSERIKGIETALSLSKSKIPYSAAAGADGDFTRTLQDHATGYLAPLIKNLELYWNSPILRQGITLVDLPGVGVMRDLHREVTRYWIREKANALVLIVDHRGLYDSVAEALKQSEFLNALLYSADEPEDDPIVLVAVTRIDDIASDRYQQNKSKKKFEHFFDVTQEAREKLRQEVRRSLESIWLADNDIQPSRRKVVENLLSKLQVHPISAPEYARLRANDDDDQPFLKSIEQSGVPQFLQALVDVADQRNAKSKARIREESSLFRERLSSTLRLIQSQWTSNVRAEEESKKLKQELELFMGPLRKELHVRQGGYRTFLKKTIPQRIGDLVVSASLKANTQIARYLMRLGDSHWATLRASVRRGGRYSGASDINLPTEFALRFEEPIAESWGKEILKDIRQETRDYACDCVRLVEEVSNWALKQGARVQPKLIEAQRDAIRADAKKLESVGREMVKEIRDEAKMKLINRIEGPIKRRCEAFVKKNLDVGIGVKQRILVLYCDMAEEVTEAAQEPATLILQQLFKEVEKEILDAFKEHENPLDALAEAVVASQASFIKHSDAQKRSRTLEEVDGLLDALPTEATDLARV